MPKLPILRRLSQSLLSIKPVYLLIAAALICLICINALRTNNLTMVRLRSDVYQADQKNGDVRGALTDLQHYVTSHMNTDLTPGNNAVYPPIQLKYTYERLQAAANIPADNTQLYTDAQNYCESINHTDITNGTRAPCIAEYVNTHAVHGTTKTIPDSLYKFDFLSPSWSPDLAGWSMVVTVVLFLVAVGLWLARKLHSRS